MEECLECGYSCDSLEKLERHLKVHAVTLRCAKCDYNAPSRKLWREHIKTPEHVRTHTCGATTSCTFVGETEKQLHEHVRYFHRGRLRNYKCSKCDFVGETGFELKRHAVEHKKEEIIATVTKQFKCDLCQYSAESERKYKNHIWRHTSERNYKCDRCDYFALTESKLTNHQRKHDEEGMTFNCPVCDKSFKTQCALKGHKRLHKKRSFFHCPITETCTFTTTMVEYVRSHCKSQHPEVTVYKCTKCDFFTQDTDELEKHVAALHAAANFFSCELCEYATDRKTLFENHVRIKHATTGNKKSRCVICKAVFPNTEELQEHMESHKESDKKSFDCSKCSFKTVKYGDFRSHICEHLDNETEKVSGNIELPEDWMEKPSIISKNKSPVYPGYGPLPKKRHWNCKPLPDDAAAASPSSSSSSFSTSSSPSSSLISAGSGRWKHQSPSASSYDFKKNVGAFAAKRRRGATPSGEPSLAMLLTMKSEISMTPVFLKEEPNENGFAGDEDGANAEDVKPDVGAMEMERQAREEEEEANLRQLLLPSSTSRDVKPDISFNNDPATAEQADVKPALNSLVLFG